MTSLILHGLVSFQIFLLAGLLVRNRVTAVVAMLLFAVMPVHSAAVSWVAARYDVLCGLWYLAGLLFFCLYRQRNQLRFYVFSLSAFALSLSSKEVAITFPALLLLYDVLSHADELSQPGDFVRRHIPFWLTLLIYTGIRGILLGRVASRGLEYIAEGWDCTNWQLGSG